MRRRDRRQQVGVDRVDELNAVLAVAVQLLDDGLDADEFVKVAEEAKAGCPVSKALTGLEITLDAALES